MNNIESNLLEYQIQHYKNIVRILNNNNACLDASDTGTGKTYTAIAACKNLNLIPFIICPKSVISTWNKVCGIFKIVPYAIVNYELLKAGKIYDKKYKKIICDNLKITVNNEKINYEWNTNENIIFIFDECHKCNNLNSLNGKLLLSVKNTNNKLLLLSATAADVPEKFYVFFYILNFIDLNLMNKNKEKLPKIFKYIKNWFERSPNPFLRINKLLYPNRASRIRIDSLGDVFPETQIVAESYSMGRKTEKKINNEYINLKKLIDKYEIGEKKGNIFVKILKSQQKIEIYKIPTFVELAKDYLENGFSIVIFVNFTKTLDELKKLLKTDCIIYGQQTLIQRNNNIEDFQNDKKRIIICNIKAGGVGISLHDINGKYPRVSFISPTWNSIDLVQAFGRIHRANGKSKSLQRIVYASNTIEEKICDKLKIKLKNIDTLNNGDLNLNNIEFNYTNKIL